VTADLPLQALAPAPRVGQSVLVFHAALQPRPGCLCVEGRGLLESYALGWQPGTLLKLGDTTTTLLPEVGTLVQVETSLFLMLVDQETITVLEPSLSPAAALSVEVHRLLTEAGPQALKVANRRGLSRLASSSFIRISFYPDNAGGAIDGNALPGRDVFCGTRNADDCRDAVFTSDDGTVRHGSPHFHDQAARREGRPARVG
jgi:hypothetical protein